MKKARIPLTLFLVAYASNALATGLPSTSFGIGWFMLCATAILFSLPLLLAIIHKKDKYWLRGLMAGLYAFGLSSYLGYYQHDSYSLTAICISFFIFNFVVFAFITPQKMRLVSHSVLVVFYLIQILKNPGIFNFVNAETTLNDPFGGQGLMIEEKKKLEFAQIALSVEGGRKFRVKQNLEAYSLFSYSKVGERVLLREAKFKDHDYDIYVSSKNPISSKGEIKPFFNFPKSPYWTKYIDQYYLEGPTAYAYEVTQ